MNIVYHEITFLRYTFFTHRQVEGQSFDEFATSLRKLSADCEFGGLNSSLIRDIIVVGVTSNRLREHMLREPSISLEQVIRLGQSADNRLSSKMLKFQKLTAPIYCDVTHRIRIPIHTQHLIPNPARQITPPP